MRPGLASKWPCCPGTALRRTVCAAPTVGYRRYSRAYVAEEDQAHRARSGIWAGTFQMPGDWRRQNRR